MTNENLGDRYELDEDGHIRELVGPWVADKHARLANYIGISRGVRQKFVGPGNAGATYIDLYCGPGRARVRDEITAIHGSPMMAWQESVEGDAPFSQLYIADAEMRVLEAADARLKKSGAPVVSKAGNASETVDFVVSQLDPYALHFAFLDPYNLVHLPFKIIKKLAQLNRMDILIHVSIQDLQRNLQRYIEGENTPLDDFAPGWREYVDVNRGQRLVRAKIWEHWRNLLKAEGMTTTETAELVVGSRNQRLYFLAFAARHKLAIEFWEKVRNLNGREQLTLL